MTPESPSSTIHLPKGFSFASAAAGIKASGRADLALAAASEQTTAAAMFTRNRVLAAPVQVGREYLTKSQGRLRAVLVNSGNANCATGAAGLSACRRVCQEAGKLLRVKSFEVLPSSTGIIGVPLPEQKILAGLPAVVSSLSADEKSAIAFAETILTTDTKRKTSSTQLQFGKSAVSLLGVAKGSGMIHPQLATMLVYIFSDIAATPRELKTLLRDACDESFNCMSVDGDTSTNDTVLLMASGQSGIRLSSAGVRKKFSSALHGICQSLADQIIADGEGVHHVIRLFVEQARSREEALTIARAIAHSLLVKTAWAGSDPNWGRILAAVGRSGIPVDPQRIRIFVGKQLLCKNGAQCPFDEREAHSHLAQAECEVRVLLGRGKSNVRFTTTDLTAEYVRINADYST